MMESASDKVDVLRAVGNKTASGLSKGHDTGIIFQAVDKTNCPHCRAVVRTGDFLPLSWVLCPECQGKVLIPGVIDGFLLHEHIGEGEMGTIYKATDESLQREVAIKIVRGCHIADPKSRERLQREACSAGRLNHPRVAQVYALNFSNKHPYLVMELVNGLDFYQKLEAEGPIDESTALRMALDVADGLSALNREHLAHGDIKPGNIVLDRDGNAKLVDFGLSGITRFEDGALVGTPNYIAPELLRGSADTHLSDIYSFGATLYHLLSGKLPFAGETSVEILKARLSQNPVPLSTYAPHVSLPTQSLVMRMIDSNPAKRPVNAEIVSTEIKRALAQLVSPLPESREAKKMASHEFIIPRHPISNQPKGIRPRRSVWFPAFLGMIAIIELVVAFKQESFSQIWEWMRHDVGSTVKTLVVSMSRLTSNSAESDRADLLDPSKLVWMSTNLGGGAQRGSTIQSGDVTVIQANGAGMWKGADGCRFVWVKASGNYEFSVQIQTIADINDFDITGLMVKGENPAVGPGLLFGFLGNRKLFFQERNLDISPGLIKCSEPLKQFPRHLKLVRQGNMFAAWTSVDGRLWDIFSEFELELPLGNTVGLVVSAQKLDTVVSARYGDIQLKSLEGISDRPVAPDSIGIVRLESRAAF